MFAFYPTWLYVIPAEISPASPLFQKNWFCGKVLLDNFYPLLRSKSFSWIHIDIKRISQVCYLHHLWNMEKIVKHNFGMKSKIGSFFGPPYMLDEVESKTIYKDKKGDW